jgi:hypothetical protein
MHRMLAALAALAAAITAAKAEDPDPALLLARNSYPFAFDPGSLSGPGWEVLRSATAHSQFVLAGEGHDDRLTPIFVQALYGALHRAHGFDRVALEQDPVAMELACAPERKGKVKAVAELSRRYPTLFEFSSDQDLAFIAMACALGKGPDPVWGLEQSLGPERYLEELETLAPNPAVQATVSDLLAHVRTLERERKGYARFLHDDPKAQEKLEALQRAFAARPGSRADFLLTGLVKSAEIFGYDRRANEGEWVGLFNNTEREAQFKRNFNRRYREASLDAPPKVLFKFGSWHMYRGRSPGGAFTIGSFAHELAIYGGGDAYGLLVLPGSTKWNERDTWMRPLLPADRPDQPTLVDLRALRPYQRLFRLQVAEGDQWQLRDLINAFDALVILPAGPEAEWTLTGFPKLGS